MQPFLGIWSGTRTVFHNPVSPITEEWSKLVSCAVFPRAFVLPFGGPLSLLSERLNSLTVILIISIWCCSQLPPTCKRQKIESPPSPPPFRNTFCQGAVSVDRKVIVKHILGADLHAKHKFEPGSHVRQLLPQQNSVL